MTGTGRRGKYLWLLLDTEPPGVESATALVVHLGMSGQMLLGDVPRADHVRISAQLDDGIALSFVDQRTFGGWLLADLVVVDGSIVPAPVAHLARDPLDPRFDAAAVVAVGMWKSRAFCGISKRNGKVAFTFPRSAFSIALFPADSTRKFLRRPVSQTAVRTLLVVLPPPKYLR